MASLPNGYLASFCYCMFQPTSTLTASNAKTTLEAGLQAVKSGQSSIDLSQLTAVDSTAVAVLLGWQRAASEQGRVLRLDGIPANLQSLAELYGVLVLLRS